MATVADDICWLLVNLTTDIPSRVVKRFIPVTTRLHSSLIHIRDLDWIRDFIFLLVNGRPEQNPSSRNKDICVLTGQWNFVLIRLGLVYASGNVNILLLMWEVACNWDPAPIGTNYTDPRPVSGTRHIRETQLPSEVSQLVCWMLLHLNILCTSTTLQAFILLLSCNLLAQRVMHGTQVW